MDIIGLVVTIVVLGIVFWLLYWLVQKIPEPFHTVGEVLVAVAAVVIILGILFGYVPRPVLRL